MDERVVDQIMTAAEKRNEARRRLGPAVYEALVLSANVFRHFATGPRTDHGDRLLKAAAAAIDAVLEPPK